MHSITTLYQRGKKTYCDIPIPIRAAVWFTIANAVYSGIKFLVTPILTRFLTQEQYGVIGIYNSWSNMAVVLIGLSLSKGIFFTGLHEYSEDRKKYTASFLGLSIIITICWYLLFLCFKEKVCSLLGMDSRLIHTLFIYLLFVPGLEFWQAEKRYDFSYKKLTTVLICSALSAQVAGILFMLFTNEKQGEAYLIASNWSYALIGGFACFRILNRSKFAFKLKYWIYGIKYNIPLIPYYLSAFILAQLDRILILHLRSFEEVGLYIIDT